MAVEARQNVTRWAAEHFAYRAKDVAQLASLFDDVIAEVRAASGARNTSLALVAGIAAPPDVPLMNAPDLQESAEAGLRAAALTTDPSDRTSLLRAINDSLTGSQRRPGLDGVASRGGCRLRWRRRAHREELFAALGRPGSHCR